MSATQVIFTEQLSSQFEKMLQGLVYENVKKLAEHYKFDTEEAVRVIGLSDLEVVNKKPREKAEKKQKTLKPAFPLPYNGEFIDNCCQGLSKNNGLYTQCCREATPHSSVDNRWCKKCKVSAENNNGVPEFGTIQMRLAVGIMEYKDPNGKAPTPYVKVMKKYGLTEEQVCEEAGKFNIIVDPLHFVSTEEVKKGRPAKEKKEKTSGGKQKGRPKKVQKVVEISENETEDLFSSLVEMVHAETVSTKKENTIQATTKHHQSLPALEFIEKQTKAKEPKVAKESKTKEPKVAKESKAKEPKVAKESKAKEPKVAKESKAKEPKVAKESKTKETVTNTVEETVTNTVEETVTNTVTNTVEEGVTEEKFKSFEHDGIVYLRGKRSGILYSRKDYLEGYQHVIGHWDEENKRIIYASDSSDSEEEDEASGDEASGDEESEEEYDD